MCDNLQKKRLYQNELQESQGSKTVFQIAFSSIKLHTSLCGSEEGQQCTGDLSARFQTWIILESFCCYGRWQRHPSLTCKEYQVDVCIYKSLIFLSFFPFPLFLEEQMLIAVFRQSLGCVSHNSESHRNLLTIATQPQILTTVNHHKRRW